MNEETSLTHDESEMLLAVYNDLTERERASVDAHMQNCTTCAAMLNDYRQMDRTLAAFMESKTAPDVVQSSAKVLGGDINRHKSIVPRFMPRFNPQWAAAAALLLLVFLFSAVLSGDVRQMVRQLAGGDVPHPVPTAQQATTDDTVTIRFGCQQLDCKRYEELALEFEEEHPEIDIEVLELWRVVGPDVLLQQEPDAYLERVNEKLDAARLQYISPAPAAKSLLDLRAFIETDPAISVDDFYAPEAWDNLWLGQIYGLPTHVVPSMLMFDKAAFDEAGVPYPTTGWTRDDFLQAAIQLTKRQGDEVLRYGFVLHFLGSTHLPGYDQALAKLDAGTMTLPEILADPTVEEAVRWYTDLATRHQVTPNPKELTPDSLSANAQSMVSWRLIQNGKAAMWVDFLNPGLPAEKLQVGITSVPTDLAQTFATIPNASHAISKRTEHPQEAWRWLEFLSRHNVPTNQGLDPDQIPVPTRKSAAEDSGYWAQWSATERKAIEVAFDNVWIHSLNRQIWDARAAMLEATEAIFAGEEVVDALTMVRQRIEAESVSASTERASSTNLSAEIASPKAGEVVNGSVKIVGTATAEQFNRYELYFKPSGSDDGNYLWLGGSTAPVVEGKLGVWEVEGLQLGIYDLRLRVVKQDGNYTDYLMQDIRVAP